MSALSAPMSSAGEARPPVAVPSDDAGEAGPLVVPPLPGVPLRRVRPLPPGVDPRAAVRGRWPRRGRGPAPRPVVRGGVCGQLALAYVTGATLEAVVARVGHAGVMQVRELKRYLARHAGLAPAYLLADTLRAQPIETWWQYGGDAFLALVVELDASDGAGALGHVAVLHGRELVDPLRGGVRRVAPRSLADYQCAIVVSAAAPVPGAPGSRRRGART